MKVYTLIIIIISLQLITSHKLLSNEPAGYFDLSFEELLSTKVQIGSLLYMSNKDKPASVTIINHEDIKLTPHRNIYDLIETYVPGAFFMNHYDAPTLGIRGLMSDRNNKVLLLVNGRIANERARSGAVSELQNWDLSDIESIEIIRGPGSVTYGPGAIAGVINIVTKTIASNDASDVKFNYISQYDSKGIALKYSKELTNDLKMFSYASFQQTNGYLPEKAYDIMYNDWLNGLSNNKLEFQDYMADYFGIPQKKFHLDFEYKNNWRLWLRYSGMGSTSNGAVRKSPYQIGLDSNNYAVLNDLKNPTQTFHDHYYINLQHENELSTNWSYTASLGWDLENNKRTQGWYQMWRDNDAPSEQVYNELIDHGSLRNLYNNYSESESYINLTFTGKLSDNLRMANGVNLSYHKWGAPLFEDDNMIRMGDRSNIISGVNSPVYGSSAFFGVDSANSIFVGNGWSTLLYSLFTEVEYTPLESVKVLLSARMDKDSYSDYLLSPRLALIWNMDQSNTLKLITQQSNRLNTSEELFLENLNGNISTPEKLNTVELIYSSVLPENWHIESTVFYNDIDIVSWSDPIRTTRKTGYLSLIGAEIEAKYNSKVFTFGANHSYTKMLAWDLSKGVTSAGISYSNYLMTFSGNSTIGVGNSLNNWADNSTKLFANLYFFDRDLVIHFNTRVLWGFKGALDGITLVEELIKGTEIEQQMQESIDFMRANNFYDYDLRLNASISYRFLKKFTASLQFMNITNENNNYRYKYDAGSKAENYLFRTNILSEPFMMNFSLNIEF